MKREKLLFFGPLALLAVLLAMGFVGLRRQYDDMMFVPKPRDKARMAEALRGRFGPGLRLLSVPVVNRDVNGFAGFVRGGPPRGVYRTEAHTFSFERLADRDVCLMTTRPWELTDLRRTFLARYRESR